MIKLSKLLILLSVMGVSILFNLKHAYAEVQSSAELKAKNTHFNRYDDGGFDWQTLEAGALRVNWYNEDANFGRAALEAAQAGLQSISTFMPLDLDQPLEVFIYANADDLRGTLPLAGRIGSRVMQTPRWES